VSNGIQEMGEKRMSEQNTSRRGFFATVAIGAVSTAIAVVAMVSGARKPSVATGETADANSPLGYRETPHIRSYYRSTRV
jgi:hypothetical protein